MFVTVCMPDLIVCDDLLHNPSSPVFACLIIKCCNSSKFWVRGMADKRQ